MKLEKDDFRNDLAEVLAAEAKNFVNIIKK